MMRQTHNGRWLASGAHALAIHASKINQLKTRNFTFDSSFLWYTVLEVRFEPLRKANLMVTDGSGRLSDSHRSSPRSVHMQS